ncbi:MAG: AAA family ATPase [Bdellovibrionaceae bacterium]|nr:AAA family ATPase [Pseudobdellovibrionaceae bacterium]
MLVGSIGTGKTHCCGTLLADYENGIWVPNKDSYIKEVFHLYTEPSMETLSGLSCADGYHYAYVPAASSSWDEMERSADDINRLSLKALASKEGMNKSEYRQFIQLFSHYNNFTCDRCGESFGDVSTWDNTRALITDSLSGINIMAMDLVVGSKPVRSMSDWGISMDRITRLVNKLCADTACLMVLTAHLEIERDEVTGRMRAMPSTLGKKLAPILPRFFSEVIECKHEENNFFWSTSNEDTDTKTRNLPHSPKLKPSFQPMLDTWREKHGLWPSTR